MRLKEIKFGVAEVLEVTAVTAYFAGMALLLIVWQPGSWGWGFLIHALSLFCLVSALFSFSLSGCRIRRPFSLPEILLFIFFLYEIINAIFSRVPYASRETLPFILNGLILFYVGSALFARRHEGFLLTMFLFITGMVCLMVFTRYGDSWLAPVDPDGLYRGKKMLIAAFMEHPLKGCGNGALPFLATRYLPLGDRRPPRLDPVYGRFLAEQGIIGALILTMVLAGIISSLFTKQGEKNPVKKTRIFCFWFAIILGGMFLFSGFLSLPLSFPMIIYGFLPLSGVAMILRQKRSEPVPWGEKPFQKPGILFSLGILIPVFLILVWEISPFFAARLIRFRQVSDLSKSGFGRRIKAAQILMPCHPEIYLMQAKHLRAQASVDSKDSNLPIELAYLRALRKNPYNERYYLEYAHFLELARDYKGMTSTLKRGEANCPGSVEIKMLLFRGYMNLGLRREALDALNSLRRYYPLDYASHERLARYYAEAGAQGASSEERILAAQTSPAFNQGK
ncbi:hypothetical protein JW926_06255 [Candidatus Sumerlaeota bacterium]|nr:hypothetical protein [Candidatus Sumerlaeota bacterium]